MSVSEQHVKQAAEMLAAEYDVPNLSWSDKWLTDGDSADHPAVRCVARLIAALDQIASFRDEGANQYLAATGSYGAFDEPGSVEIARATLSQLSGEKESEG